MPDSEGVLHEDERYRGNQEINCKQLPGLQRPLLVNCLSHVQKRKHIGDVSKDPFVEDNMKSMNDLCQREQPDAIKTN